MGVAAGPLRVWTDAHLSPALAPWLTTMLGVDARHGPPPQIVWLTCGNTTDAAVRGILADAWPRVAALLAAGEPLIEIGGRAS